MKKTNYNYYDYKKLRKNKKENLVDKIPESGLWLPISIVSFITKQSNQKLRLDYLSNKIDGIKFPEGPLLINLKSVSIKESKKN